MRKPPDLRLFVLAGTATAAYALHPALLLAFGMAAIAYAAPRSVTTAPSPHPLPFVGRMLVAAIGGAGLHLFAVHAAAVLVLSVAGMPFGHMGRSSPPAMESHPWLAIPLILLTLGWLAGHLLIGRVLAASDRPLDGIGLGLVSCFGGFGLLALPAAVG